MTRAAALAALLVAAGCGTTTGPGATATSAAGTVVLKAVCPLVHTSYDALVASTPSSQQAFVADLERIWDEADAVTRAAVSPLLGAAKGLAAAGRGDGFAEARDAVHTAVVGLSDRCAAEGRPILHAGH